tara:strand:- start:1342 stop:1860 length:519 start_codon:yes stop_codon:yes gene_type:complete
MGVGKTTIGRLLAHELRLRFIDSDQEIEKRAGAEIAWIFDMEGEQGFRERETRVLEDICQQTGLLIATGGGAVLRNENRRILNQFGVVVFLDTTVDVQLKRTGNDKKRPLLQSDDRRAVLTKMREERDPIYLEVADVHVNVGDASSRRTVNKIIRLLEKQGVVVRDDQSDRG